MTMLVASSEDAKKSAQGSQRKLMRGRVRSDLSGCVDFQFYRVVRVQQKRAGVFHAPFYVRDREVRVALQVRSGGWLNGERHREIVVLAVNAKCADDVYLRRFLRIERASDLLRRENNLRILRAFQDFLMHLLVARFVVGIGAARVHHDGAAGLAAGRIKMNLTAL